MGFYQRYLFPPIMDFFCGMMNEMRGPALARAHGDVLEIGFGTGRNLPHYPGDVKTLTALDPMRALNRRVEARVQAAPFPVAREALPADGALPFASGRFDCVVSTWTLCSVDDPGAALGELRRVLKPGGLFLFIEHGRSPHPGVARWQDRITPLWRPVFGGCRLTLEIDKLIRDSGFTLSEMEAFVPPGRRSFSDQQYRGVATPSAAAPPGIR